MAARYELLEHPKGVDAMIVGWTQWADAGDVSSGLPEYLVDLTNAREIGSVIDDHYYLFQMPAGHHLMRPVVKLHEGRVQSLSEHENLLYYAGDGNGGLAIFRGEEPHLNAEQYVQAILDVAQELEVARIIVVGGVYGAVPYERDRDISCVYTLPALRKELENYAVRFSNYEGGSTIGTYLAKRAEERGMELVAFHALVPSYDLSHEELDIQPIAVGEDYKAWYDLLVRIDHMFGLDLDLTDIEERARALISAWDAKISQLATTMPQLNVEEYLEQVRSEFTERPFVPLGDVWINGLKDLFDEGTGE